MTILSIGGGEVSIAMTRVKTHSLGPFLSPILRAASCNLMLTHRQDLERHSFSKLKGYYDGKANLAAYTIDTELQRMRYEIIGEDGNRVAAGDKDLARAFLAARKRHPIVRMANQSIFADMLQASAVPDRCLAPPPGRAAAIVTPGRRAAEDPSLAPVPVLRIGIDGKAHHPITACSTCQD